MNCEKVSWDLLVRTADKELLPSEAAWISAHIAGCVDCRRELAALEDLSLEIESVVNSVPVSETAGDRERLLARIQGSGDVKPIRQAPEKVMRRFGWGMAIAASLAIGIIVAPKPRPAAADLSDAAQSTSAASAAIEVDGETFVPLPYSNPDLPTSAPRIVQMQVPVSSLADIGISLVPVVNGSFNQDRTVLADVLLGADGQPLGVHVVSWQ